MSDPINRDHYPPGAEDEVTVPPTDPVREAKQRDIGDPADVDISGDADTDEGAEQWRQGGPTQTPGAVTTTGGTAGPGMRRATGQQAEGKVAPTTTGDATSGGMEPPAGGSTSDATRSAPPDESEVDEQ